MQRLENGNAASNFLRLAGGLIAKAASDHNTGQKTMGWKMARKGHAPGTHTFHALAGAMSAGLKKIRLGQVTSMGAERGRENVRGGCEKRPNKLLWGRNAMTP